jgi:hypothetical protein
VGPLVLDPVIMNASHFYEAERQKDNEKINKRE